MKKAKTWTATIYVGLRIGYHGQVLPISEPKAICQKYCNIVGWAVTVTKTRFIYKWGTEPGVIIGIIQYPRFPSKKKALKVRTMTLAQLLLSELKQERLTVVFPDETIMLEKE